MKYPMLETTALKTVRFRTPLFDFNGEKKSLIAVTAESQLWSETLPTVEWYKW